uniref:SLC26A/SulP transporter domain-containing protein n=1 Tax=Panagrolaimus sp. JU765 TaxID=591449 RepID=A0AC34QAJ8_9BILA
MSEDADGGPDVYEASYDFPPPYSVNGTRHPMNQEEFDAKYGYHRPDHRHGIVTRRCIKLTRRYWKPFTSPKNFLSTVISFFPILRWLPKYDWKRNLTYDFLGGLTVGVMHVPQSIAYALLAKVPPVVGLYTSLFPALFYMLFGTSMHNSIGSFAVVSLMAGKSVTKLCPEPLIDGDNGTLEDGLQDKFEDCALTVASTLAFCVGLIHLLMALLRLEIVVTYFSDQLVAGFTTAASCHVFVTQLPALFGMKGIANPSGVGYLFRKLYSICKHLDRTNWMTTIVGFSSIAFLVIGKDYVNPVLQKKLRLPVPIPFELILVILATVISTLCKLNFHHHVEIVEEIPTGLPTPHFPQFGQLGELMIDGLSIAVVVVAIHISLAKMFGKKLNYKVDPGQELYAIGFASSLSSFFPIYPVSCSLGRTMVAVEAGTKTQLSTIASSAFLIAIIAYVGKWLENLPMCVLSAVVIVALKGMAKKFLDLKTLWPLSKVDFSIWVVSFVATVGWDVTPGLAISIAYALMTTVFRTQFPRWHLLASLFGTNDFRDAERYHDVIEHKGICIF